MIQCEMPDSFVIMLLTLEKLCRSTAFSLNNIKQGPVVQNLRHR